MDGSTFYHIVCVLDKANDSAYIYQDGTKVWEQTSLSLSESDFPITPSTYVAIGREQQTTDINIKTFRVWENHALSAAEITTLYNNRNTNYFTFRTLRTQNPPIYDWDFRQASSTTITDSIGGLTATYTNLLLMQQTVFHLMGLMMQFIYLHLHLRVIVLSKFIIKLMLSQMGVVLLNSIQMHE